MGRSGSIKRPAAAALAAPPSFTVKPGDYRLMEEVGYGAHAVVYRAVFLPRNEVVAVKCLDLDQLNNNIDEIQREAQIMSLIDHPNVIRAYCSFVVEHSLWVVMPFMREGSCLHLMKIAYPDGFEEPVIGSILKETLKALEYLHNQGQIHRDVKAGNILIDSAGAVKLGDFGVSACMFDRGWLQKCFSLALDITSIPDHGKNVAEVCVFLQLKDAAQLALKKMPSSEQEALSLSEYQRGVSAWNFDIEDLKAQASLIRDDEPPEIKEDDDTARNTGMEKDLSFRNHLGKPSSESNYRERAFATTVNSDGKGPSVYEAFDFGDADCKNRIDGYQNNRAENGSSPSTSKQDSESNNNWTSDIEQRQQASGANNNTSVERIHGFERSISYSLILLNDLLVFVILFKSYVDSLGDKSKRNVVEIKGRFSVTSENVDLAKVQDGPAGGLSRKSQQGLLLRKSASVGDWLAKPMCNSNQLKELCNSSVSSSILIPHLENLVQQTMFQQELIMNLLGGLQQNEKVDGAQPGVSENDRIASTANSEKERSLLVTISELQSRMITLTDELIAAKLKHVQLQQELNALYCREEIEDIRDEDNEET
ncbi:hypothetical protein PR202_gb07223 [Eleusine coracana subsp. coracana]|uniref:Protein kinase domain-containing protein n=1 Tax=Eleusine coracana subsp. coracana TaxID=191504 RepID=A0AAV5EAY9_ELECO|nr:hypothetical protein PR202_gb07223 [Eleusine coracana subsp. coracana]